jgi:hypothetical protein
MYIIGMKTTSDRKGEKEMKNSIDDMVSEEAINYLLGRLTVAAEAHWMGGAVVVMDDDGELDCVPGASVYAGGDRFILHISEDQAREYSDPDVGDPDVFADEIRDAVRRHAEEE